MRAINLSAGPVELSAVNGVAMLPAASGDTDDHERDLAEVTDHERALADAGKILIVDAKGRKRAAKPKTDKEGDG